MFGQTNISEAIRLLQKYAIIFNKIFFSYSGPFLFDRLRNVRYVETVKTFIKKNIASNGISHNLNIKIGI